MRGGGWEVWPVVGLRELFEGAVKPGSQVPSKPNEL
jgi:hypothetical protein